MNDCNRDKLYCKDLFIPIFFRTVSETILLVSVTSRISDKESTTDRTPYSLIHFEVFNPLCPSGTNSSRIANISILK